MEPKEGQSRPSKDKWWVMALIMNVSVPQQKLAYANITKTDVYAVHSIQSNRDLSGNNKSLYCLKGKKKHINSISEPWSWKSVPRDLHLLHFCAPYTALL